MVNNNCLFWRAILKMISHSGQSKAVDNCGVLCLHSDVGHRNSNFQDNTGKSRSKQVKGHGNGRAAIKVSKKNQELNIQRKKICLQVPLAVLIITQN